MHGVECSAEVDFFSELRRLLNGRRMDARSRLTTQSLAENTSSVATGTRPTDRPFGELGEKVAKAAARRGSYRPTALVFTIAGPSCPLFPLGCACGNSHCGHAPLS